MYVEDRNSILLHVYTKDGLLVLTLTGICFLILLAVVNNSVINTEKCSMGENSLIGEGQVKRMHI